MGDGAAGAGAPGGAAGASTSTTTTPGQAGAPVEGGGGAWNAANSEGGTPSTGAQPIRGADGKFTSAAVPMEKDANGGTPPAPSKKYKLKRGKEDVEVDEAKVLHLAQKGYGAAEYFEEGRRARDEAAKVQAKMDALEKSSPAEAKAILREMVKDGGRLRELAEEIIYEHIEAEKLTPEQRELQTLKAKLADRDRADKETQAKAEEARLEQETQGLRDRFAKTARAALEKVGLPKESTWVGVRRMGPRIAQALEMGQDPEAVADELAGDVRDELLNEHRSLAKGMEGQALLDWLGEEVVTKIRRFDLARLRGGNQPVVRPASGTSPTGGGANGKQLDPRKGRWSIIEEMERMK